MANRFTKQVCEILDYKFDWSSLLVDGDTIASYTLTPTNITIDSDSIVDSGASVQYIVSGGTAGVNATVKCEVVTTNGLEDCATAYFTIVADEVTSLIVEDGTGIEFANALIDTDYMNSWLNSRNIDTSSYSRADIEGAIVVASADFISVWYQFNGTLLNDDQGLSIPTNLVGITNQIKQATANAAYLHLQGKLFVSASDINTGGNVKRTMRKVGTLETETEYQDGSGGYTTKYPTPTIDRLLQPYITGGGFAPAMSLRY